MADQDIMHTADIMKAALPFIDVRNKVMVEFFMKAFDLMGSLKSLKGNKNMAACGFEAGKIDVEGLLNGIRPVCSVKEREIIDRILSFFNMKRMFEMYNKMMEMMKNMQDLGGFDFSGFGNFGDSGSTEASGSSEASADSGGFGNSGIFGNFGTSGNTEASNNSGIFGNFDTSGNADATNNSGIFGNFGTSGNTEASNNSGIFGNYGSFGDDAENITSNFGSQNYESIFNYTENSFAKEKTETEYSDEYHQEDKVIPDSNKDKAPQAGNANKINDNMLNMLKAMIPPEKMSTFENLSMLLNTMSYDNNSKPETYKEHKDGDS